MSKEILQDIINKFSVEKFIGFFRAKNDKLHYPDEPLDYEDDKNSPETNAGQVFTQGRKLAEGKLDDGDLIVCSFLVKKDLTERSGKKAQYKLGKEILKLEQADAGIFIFYDPQGNFRFSLIYTNYLGKRRDWSNFKRFTYFVSPELTNKTFLKQIGEGDFSTLEKIKEAFSVEKVTKEFYQEIANWYFWAVQESKFPDDAEKEENGRNIAAIRLITRMIFIWFMKVRNLIPDELFDINSIEKILKDVTPDESTYYKAVLQNLFFATLNTKQEERKFRTEIRGHKGYNPDFGNPNVYRYHKLFKNPDKMQEYFGNIPFLNGGLFDCLDYKSKKKEERFYIDGFTDTKQYQPFVPNFLFFTEEKNVDLNQEYGTKGKRYKVRGLIDILSSYNFTIDENEPDDFEVALDPELLGRVFENLLASYNPETATTARKATGSYNTPREIVDYMVTQSLKYYFKTNLSDIPEIEEKLSQLFSKDAQNNPFDNSTTRRVISLIEGLRVVDPAVGSGAFPMGILNKLVFILSKLDPEKNTLWKQAQIEAIKRDVKDPILKEKLIQQAEEHFKNKDINYLRKLYLIEKCIYGVDIQQIAVEIAKLRFFISLLVDERIDKTKPNCGIEPLPNLDFKLMQGNSLISSFAEIDFASKEAQKDKKQVSFAFTTTYDELIKQFEDTKNLYQNEPDKNKKDKLRERIEDLILKIFEEKLKEHLPEFKKIEEIASNLPNTKDREKYIITEKQKLAKKLGFDLEQAQKELMAYTEGRKPKNFFLWDVYFAEVFAGENPGFDIVIANPPYGAKYSENEKTYFLNHFKSTKTIPGTQKGSLDTFAIFIEQGFNILKKQGNLIYIVPIAITSSDSMIALHSLLEENCKEIRISSYAVRPQPVFESAVVNTSILFFIKTMSPVEKILCSKMYRKGKGFNLQHLLNNLEFIDVKKYKIRGRYPKISLPIETKILDKLFSLKIRVKELIMKKGQPVYYRTTGGRYFKIITNYSTGSTKEKSIFFDERIADAIGAILSSNLFFWYYQIYSNNLDLKSYEIESFPIPLEKLKDKEIKILENLYNEYLIDIEKNANVRATTRYANIKSFKEYKIGKSKHLIDAIDDFIGPLYGLDEDEIEFVKNYEIEFRLSEEEEEKNDEDI